MKENNEDSIIVALDIGTTKICAVPGKKDKYGKLEILGVGKAVSEGVIRGMVTNNDKTVYAIQKAVDQVSKQANLDINVVNVGIAGHHIKSAVRHGSIIRRSDDEINIEDVHRLTDDMYSTVFPPGSEIIHVMPQEYTVDNEQGIKDPVGMSGVNLEADFHIITADVNAVKNLKRCIERAGLTIDNLILEPLASGLAVLDEEEKKEGVCLVDIGGGTTDIAIFCDNIIRHTAVIPFGGNVITADIKQGCEVTEEQAEKLKTKYGRAIGEEANPNEIVAIPGFRNRPPREVYVQTLANVIQARMEEIIEKVHAEIITSGYNKKLMAGIVVTGGGSQLRGLERLFEYVTGMHARIGYPNEHLGKSKVEVIKSPMYATSVGLVLSGFRALDWREEEYMERQQSQGSPGRRKRKSHGNFLQNMHGSFFQNILDKTRGLLIDDVDENKLEY